jgi:hypothetical protein
MTYWLLGYQAVAKVAMSSVPIPSFDAYELRTYEVSPATLGSISGSERFLIGVPRPMIDKIRKEPLFADATEADVVEAAFEQAWKLELLKAFRDIFQTAAVKEKLAWGVEPRFFVTWEQPLRVTSSRSCIWRHSNNVILR